MPIARMLALFLYGTYAAVIAVTRYSDFFQDDDFGGFTCPSDKIDFVEENKASLLQCLFKCSKAPTCYGVFRHERDMSCVGCRDILLTNVSAPLLNGTEYYRRQMPVYRFVEEVKSWYNAKDHCEGLGGYLADIKSQEEEDFIFSYFIPDLSYPRHTFWIGATNLKSAEYFLWQDGTNVSDGYSNWYPGQPDYSTGQCIAVSVNPSYKGQWWDTSCKFNRFSLCEFD